ncbi:hypothetical protein FRB97_001740 [Tulasnella sp. 331]|nr:hypothetical protein FRB97_001740 [Tulasnella sp. 331]
MPHFAALFCLSVIAMLVVASPIATPINADTPRTNALERRGGEYMTFFYPGLGNCGWTNSNDDLIIAVPTSTYDGGKHCGAEVRITDKSGKSLTVTVADRCPDCEPGHIDASPGVFTYFASESKGVCDISITYSW